MKRQKHKVLASYIYMDQRNADDPQDLSSIHFQLVNWMPDALFETETDHL